MDYRALLVHDTAHVIAEESVSFVENVSWTHLRTQFSQEEINELQQLAEEAARVP